MSIGRRDREMSERHKIGAVEIAETYLKRCAKDVQRGDLTRLLEQSPEAPPVEGDELPDG